MDKNTIYYSSCLVFTQISLIDTRIIMGTRDDARIHIGPSMISIEFMLGKGAAVETLIPLQKEEEL